MVLYVKYFTNSVRLNCLTEENLPPNDSITGVRFRTEVYH